MTENDRFEEAPLTAGQGEAESPLHAAAWVGDVAQIKRLIADGADVNWRDSSGETALFGAASWGETEAVRCLLAAGARHDIAEKYGYTALHWAASHGNAATLRLLLAAGQTCRRVMCWIKPRWMWRVRSTGRYCWKRCATRVLWRNPEMA